MILTLIQKLWGKHRCKVRWVTDSKSAISNVATVLDEGRLKQHQPNNTDILSIIKTETKLLRRRVKPIWVKGHQNAKEAQIQTRNTVQDVKGNNRADELATWYREESGFRQSIERIDHIPESRISISINGKRLVSQVEECIRYHINGYHLRSYIQSVHKWSNKTWDTIDVEALGLFIHRLDAKNQVARTKFVFDQWHTGYRRHQVAKIKNPSLLLCPGCKETTETTSHVLRCQRNPAREKCIKDLRKSLSPSDYHRVTITQSSHS